MAKIRTIRITLDIDLASLPREEWEEEIESHGGDDGDLDAASDDWPLEELSSDEVAHCVEQTTYNPEMFAGSMLYLQVADTRVVSHQIIDDQVSFDPVAGSKQP